MEIKKTQLTIPCYWNKGILNKIIKYSSNAINDIKVAEIYGCLAKESIGHGRAANTVPDINRKYALNFRKYVELLGLRFIYLLNAPLLVKYSIQSKEIRNYIKWIVEDFKADALMIISYELMKLVRKLYLTVLIYISTIAGIKNITQLKRFLDIKPKRVVVHHDVNRNFNDLKKLIKQSAKLNIELELMLTESCLRRCPNRDAHYKHLSDGGVDKPFHTICNARKLMYPIEFLKANFIRPEDLYFYEKMGIHIFKITGRSKKPNWLPGVVKAYLSRSYNGNLIKLLGIDPSLNAEDWIYINNKSLDGFLKSFPLTEKEKDEDIYCNEWISRLYKQKDFLVKDESKYKINSNGVLYCYSSGEHVSTIFGREK